MERDASTPGVMCDESVRSLLGARDECWHLHPQLARPGAALPEMTSSPPEPAFLGTHCARREARQPYMEGVYMLPLREERSREGLVFWLKMSWLAAWNAFSTSLLV